MTTAAATIKLRDGFGAPVKGSVRSPTPEPPWRVMGGAGDHRHSHAVRAYLGNSKLRTTRAILTLPIPWACARQGFSRRWRQTRDGAGKRKNVYENRPLRNPE